MGERNLRSRPDVAADALGEGGLVVKGGLLAQAGDAETGDYDEPRIILRLGEVVELE